MAKSVTHGTSLLQDKAMPKILEDKTKIQLGLDNDPFLTTNEAARFLSLSTKTLEAWRLQRYGPAYVKFGRSVRYRLSSLESFAKEMTEPAIHGATSYVR